MVIRFLMRDIVGLTLAALVLSGKQRQAGRYPLRDYADL